MTLPPFCCADLVERTGRTACRELNHPSEMGGAQVPCSHVLTGEQGSGHLDCIVPQENESDFSIRIRTSKLGLRMPLIVPQLLNGQALSSNDSPAWALCHQRA